VKVIENVMHQGAVTISYFNLYIAKQEITLLPLDSGVMQTLAKFGGIVTAVGAVAWGDIARHKLVKELKNTPYEQVKGIPGAITVPLDQAVARSGILKGSLKIGGKSIRVKNKIVKEVIAAQAS